MQKSIVQRHLNQTAESKIRIDVKEWDFSQVSLEASHACCIFEYARESRWITKNLRNPIPCREQEERLSKQEKIRQRSFQNCLLVQSLPPYCSTPTGFDTRKSTPLYFGDDPWLGLDDTWRASFCNNVEKNINKLRHWPTHDKSIDKAFFVGTYPELSYKFAEKKEKRVLDVENGLEAILVTIDWSNFKDGEIIKGFTKWLKGNEGRPNGLGLRDQRGRHEERWLKKLERLALLQLRHYYSFDEMTKLLPPKWSEMEKFINPSESEREVKFALEDFFELFQFLPRNQKPIHWKKVQR